MSRMWVLVRTGLLGGFVFLLRRVMHVGRLLGLETTNEYLPRTSLSICLEAMSGGASNNSSPSYQQLMEAFLTKKTWEDFWRTPCVNQCEILTDKVDCIFLYHD